jgi:hypothetical protein
VHGIEALHAVAAVLKPPSRRRNGFRWGSTAVKLERHIA